MKLRRTLKRITLLLAALLICALLPFQARAALADWYDYTGDGAVDSSDAIYLLRHVLFPADFPLEVNADPDGDGSVDSSDAIYLLRHALFGESYPGPAGAGFTDFITYRRLKTRTAIALSGDAESATAEKGEKLFEIAVARILTSMEENF